MNDVASASGVGNGSIYAAYGSKKRLYLAVLKRYCHNRVEFVGRAVAGATGDVRDGIEAFLNAVVADCMAQPGRRGCLMLNSIGVVDTVPEVEQIVASATAEMERELRLRILRDHPECEESDARALSTLAVMLSQSLIQRSQIGIDGADLQALASTSLDQCRLPG